MSTASVLCVFHTAPSTDTAMSNGFMERFMKKPCFVSPFNPMTLY